MGTITEAPKLIALIEDDVDLAKLVRSALEEAGSWRVVVIHDGAEAFKYLPTLQADLILLDVSLPGLDGISLYRILQGHRDTRQIPVLLVTASHEWQLSRQGIEPRSTAILRKPFDLDDLLERVEGMLAN
jgi:DNA-binding response OmpR family regulator